MRIRPYRPDDDADVRGLFRSTMALGRPVDDALPGLAAYEELCLGWYLGPGRGDAAVAVDSTGTVVGYALVCLDGDAHHRWSRRMVVRTAGRVAPRLPLASRAGRRFWWLRVRDSWDLRAAPVLSAHAHINVASASRVGTAALGLMGHVDAVVAAAGAPGWVGEINARVGTRSAALVRLGGTVVDRRPNRTLSWLCGHPVERLTVVRSVAVVAAA